MSDNADTARRLFDPAKTAPTTCRHCLSTRRNLCRYDADQQGVPTRERPRRPRGCLAQTVYDPKTSPFPEGF